jgi:hypothetical protein
MLIDLNRIGEPGYRTAELAGYAVVLTVVAVLITVTVARTRRDRTVALAYAFPLAGAGFLLLSAAALGSWRPSWRSERRGAPARPAPRPLDRVVIGSAHDRSASFLIAAAGGRRVTAGLSPWRW